MRADLEHDDQQQEQDQTGQLRLFEIGLEQTLHGRLQEFELLLSIGGAQAPPMQSRSLALRCQRMPCAESAMIASAWFGRTMPWPVSMSEGARPIFLLR